MTPGPPELCSGCGQGPASLSHTWRQRSFVLFYFLNIHSVLDSRVLATSPVEAPLRIWVSGVGRPAGRFTWPLPQMSSVAEQGQIRQGAELLMPLPTVPGHPVRLS